MTVDRETNLAKIDTNYYWMNWCATEADNYHDKAQTHWLFQQDHKAIEDIIDCLSVLIAAIQYAAWIYPPYSPKGAVPYFLRYHTGNGDEYELTAQKICEAWLEGNFAERTLTIGFIDRMRQLLWNEPFNAVWAAKPTLPEQE